MMRLDTSTLAQLAAASVEVLREDEISPLMLLCEHAGAQVPAPWGSLGLDPAFLTTHYAWDPGVDGLTRDLSARLAAPAVLTRYSRIFTDYNRFADDWDHMRPDLGGIPVPANLAICPEERSLRRAIAVDPVDRAIRRVLNGRRAVVSVHSFTPVMAGDRRPVDIGVLWREDSPFIRAALAGLQARGTALGLRIGDNAPYDWRKVEAYSLDAHGLRRGLPCFYLEINNALFGTPAEAALGPLLAAVLNAALETV
ncbi:N-formylglutamate amidohydrolase [Gemmobacter serpentinus]|uniref:N-formylglutamate amidohydrolase n=1 Tax=Gemmobacter serpentinus TaxID=2652247 RepID=UPI00124F2A54|nr:N-formylglutamate amidohydrolase [Gemmobacter serpentinus]